MPPAATEPPVDLRVALQRLGAAQTPWYVLLDAAQAPSAVEAAHDAGLGTTCLYTGGFGRQLEGAAPHLATFDPSARFAGWLHGHWEGSHGVLLQSAAPHEALRRHLKKFLLVKSPEGRTLRFRFYDPRVLRAFLPVCSSTELTEFFGPVVCYMGAGRPGPSLTAFSLARGQLVVRRAALLRPATEPAAGPPERSDLHVIVLDAVRGTPIERAGVVVEGVDYRSAVTASHGRTTFHGLPHGAYRVSAIDGELREGRCDITFDSSTDPVFLLCRRKLIRAPTA